MKYGDIKKIDVLNGEGLRLSLFVSGCHNHCKGCFNTKLKDFNYGIPFTNQTIDEIIKIINNPNINYQGISLLGGDPMAEENCVDLTNLCQRIKKETHKDIWLWTGYLYEDILNNPIKYELLQYIDVLIDGQFIESKKDLTLKFRGSSNQRIIDVQKTLLISDIYLYIDD